MIEVGKAKKGLYTLGSLGHGPASNTVQFDGVHGKLTRFNNHPKVVHLSSGEAAFLKFEVEI